MAVNFKNIAEKVMRVIQGNGLQPKLFSSQNGKSVAVPTEARYFYTDEPNLMVFIDDDTGEIKFHMGENVDIDNPVVRSIMKSLKNITREYMLDFDIRTFGKHIEPKHYASNVEKNKEQTKEQDMSDVDVLGEGMSPLEGSSRTSRQTLENVRLIVKHKAPVNEEQRGSRSRNISAIFVENSDGERFKYPFKHLSGARAMARHVSTGGVPSDMVGEAIVEMSSNLAKLKEFNNTVNKQGLINETNRTIVMNVKQKMESIKESIKRIQGAKGYAAFVESMALNEVGLDVVLVCKDCGDEQGKPTTDCVHDCNDQRGSHWVSKTDISEDVMNDYVSKFTKSTFEESLKDIIPLIHKVNEEENENNRVNSCKRVSDIIEATCKDTGEKRNRITFSTKVDEFDMSVIKEPATEQEEGHRGHLMASQFDDLAERVCVETTDDNMRKNKGYDRASVLSSFLSDFAEEVRNNPRNLDEQKVQLAGQLLKIAKESEQASDDGVVENNDIDTKMNNLLESAFSKFNLFN
jgi:hypothetical protein